MALQVNLKHEHALLSCILITHLRLGSIHIPYVLSVLLSCSYSHSTIATPTPFLRFPVYQVRQLPFLAFIAILFCFCILLFCVTNDHELYLTIYTDQSRDRCVAILMMKGWISQQGLRLFSAIVLGESPILRVSTLLPVRLGMLA